MAEIILDQRVKQTLLVPPEARQSVIDAFNAYYAHVYKYCYSPTYPRRDFVTLNAGVKLATGLDNVHPDQAIPPSYQGDGSFQTRYKVNEGRDEVIQTEYLPWRFPEQDSKYAWFKTLIRFSRLFVKSHEPYFADRVNLEAYYRSEEDKRLKRVPDDSYNYRTARLELSEAREIYFPFLENR